jgi:hypothetical protein
VLKPTQLPSLRRLADENVCQAHIVVRQLAPVVQELECLSNVVQSKGKLFRVQGGQGRLDRTHLRREGVRRESGGKWGMSVSDGVGTTAWVLLPPSHLAADPTRENHTG